MTNNNSLAQNDFISYFFTNSTVIPTTAAVTTHNLPPLIHPSSTPLTIAAANNNIKSTDQSTVSARFRVKKKLREQIEKDARLLDVKPADKKTKLDQNHDKDYKNLKVLNDQK
ncbi:5207_t:CDS:2 [Entrophospora sp. SA101]|nr:5207_t:CDS:2 [Entrophospora sp. SA101]CAJ0896026.1 4005_t:CDS:2 [Entrophospora sp. SA101]CAJ0896059.1 4009_t:CDS:2 [Entrophospora sp. SA101]